MLKKQTLIGTNAVILSDVPVRLGPKDPAYLGDVPRI
jgi:hypothetical protein